MFTTTQPTVHTIPCPLSSLLFLPLPHNTNPTKSLKYTLLFIQNITIFTPPSLSLSLSFSLTITTAMTDLHHSSNLLLVMDCLWFNHAVLSSEPILTPTSKPTTPPPSISQSQTSLDSESELFSTTTPEEEHSDSSDSSPASPKDDSLGDDTEEASEEGEPEYRYKRLRPTRLRTTQRRSRSQSSSPSLQSLTKTSSCKSLYELEYEEVKGFMDLGFNFKKDKLCPRMMSVLPGLQRLDEYKDGIEGLCTAMDELKDYQIKEEIDGKEKAVPRPYLSEAWLIRRPDSPLLNMRIPRISTSSPNEVKKHLKSWARTVATSIQLEY